MAAAQAAGFTDSEVQDALDAAGVEVPRGEPRRRVAAVVDALAGRASEPELRAALASTAELLWDDAAAARVTRALAGRAGADTLVRELARPAEENALALGLAYHAALRVLARDARVKSWLAELEPVLEGLDDEDRARFAPVLARAATPALAVDVEQLKDEGYRYVATYPPEGSEGVDIVGKAASWLTRRLTVDGDAPRAAMRRFLALLAEEVEVELPVVSELLDRLVEAPVPPAAPADAPFLALARGLVEEAVAERGPPF